MLDHISVVSGLLCNAIEALELARTIYGKAMAVTDGAAVLVGYDRDDLIGRLASAAVEAGLDLDTAKVAIEAGKARAEVARQYRESTPPPKRLSSSSPSAETPTAPSAVNDNVSASLHEAIRIQALDREWSEAAAAAAIETTNRVNEAEKAQRPTPASTVEALLYELRSGLSCLSDHGARDRLRRCGENAIRIIAAELLTRKGKNKPWLPPWSEEDVAKLFAIKGGLK
jgi:hypothetical protein